MKAIKQLKLYIIAFLAISCNTLQTQTFTFDNSINAFPQLNIKNDSVNAKITSMNVEVIITGTIAQTRYDITFFNPSSRVLEGELNFPLKENQQIVDFSMDIERKMRKGVVVEKNKGRQVFEAIVREGIDPGLVEKTSGNNFRARVYPILANGTKQLSITCMEELDMFNHDPIYILPLQFNTIINQFSLKFEIQKTRKTPKVIENNLTPIQFKNWHESYLATTELNDFNANGFVAISLPMHPKKNEAYSQSYDGEDYFYSSLKIDAEPKSKSKLNHLHLVWDISGSGCNRNINKELNILEDYLRYHNNPKVSLSTFNHQLHHLGDFNNWSQLKNAILNLSYDGGSNLNDLEFNLLSGEEIILVTDGLSNIGNVTLQKHSKPIVSINSSVKSNHAFLRQLSQKSNGSSGPLLFSLRSH